MDNKKAVYIVAAIVAIGIVAVLALANKPKDSKVASDADGQVMMKKDEAMDADDKMMKDDKATGDVMMKFDDAKKSAHYESNSPAHGEILAAPPINVVVDFNFDLAPPSSISIMKDGKEYGQGETVIDNNKLSMRRSLTSDAPDGTYKVTYKACWPDKSCHDGSFEFAIDRSKASGYENMQNKKEITIRMSEIMFAPKNISISPGTQVTWVNDEDVEHYINTNSHPPHTYYPMQNSRSLAKGATYSVTFDKSGAYPYHCSAHAETMIGNIIVI